MDFSVKTSTGVLQQHLAKSHIALWVSACEEKKIEIVAKEVQENLAQYHQQPQQTELEANRLEFSKESFLNALLEFIIADDQVSLCLDGSYILLIYH
jgi:hypothetical protein